MARAKEGWRGRARIYKSMVEARNIGIMGHRQVALSWSDDPVMIHDGRQWRGCRGRRVLFPPEGHWTAVREGGVGKE